MPTDSFVDATVFLGMHSLDETDRRACKWFFVTRLTELVAISLEQVGRCDDVVWRFPREIQDAYYPFMDNLHTELKFARTGYADGDVRQAGRSAQLAGLPTADRLLLGMVKNREGTLYSLDPRLLRRPGLPVRRPPMPPTAADVTFPPALEHLYQASLVLRVDAGRLRERPCTAA